MDIESVRSYCLSLPGATEDIQWGCDLLFRVGNKIFTSVVLEPSAPYRISFKCTRETFAKLIENEGIDPAPYTGRYNWVALKTFDALTATEIRKLIKDSYDMVVAKLPTKLRP